jgi:hypothetical protein
LCQAKRPRDDSAAFRCLCTFFGSNREILFWLLISRYHMPRQKTLKKCHQRTFSDVIICAKTPKRRQEKTDTNSITSTR